MLASLCDISGRRCLPSGSAVLSGMCAPEPSGRLVEMQIVEPQPEFPIRQVWVRPGTGVLRRLPGGADAAGPGATVLELSFH